MEEEVASEVWSVKRIASSERKRRPAYRRRAFSSVWAERTAGRGRTGERVSGRRRATDRAGDAPMMTLEKLFRPPADTFRGKLYCCLCTTIRALPFWALARRRSSGILRVKPPRFSPLFPCAAVQHAESREIYRTLDSCESTSVQVRVGKMPTTVVTVDVWNAFKESASAHGCPVDVLVLPRPPPHCAVI